MRARQIAETDYAMDVIFGVLLQNIEYVRRAECSRTVAGILAEVNAFAQVANRIGLANGAMPRTLLAALGFAVQPHLEHDRCRLLDGAPSSHEREHFAVAMLGAQDVRASSSERRRQRQPMDSAALHPRERIELTGVALRQFLSAQLAPEVRNILGHDEQIAPGDYGP